MLPSPSYAAEILVEDGLIELVKKSLIFLYDRRKTPLHFSERFLYKIRRPGIYIFEEEWDTCIILDACRADVFNQVKDEQRFLNNAQMNTVNSPASSSAEWMQKNFRDKYDDKIAKTAYVTANPFSQNYADKAEFAILDEVWRYGWDDTAGVVPPEVVTDRAINIARSGLTERLLVHYMQPHFPSLRRPELGSKIDPETNDWINNIWDRIKRREINQETAVTAYKQNLRDVLTNVERLLSNHDASRVIISADHGNAFGERGIYGHPPNRAIPVLREVPWVETTADDEKTHTPREYDKDVNNNVIDRLQALGYK